MTPTYDELWARQFPILLHAHPRIIRAALPYLRKSSSPRIVNIASTEALGATAMDSIYAAAKAGVTGFTRALAVELGREGITVNCICPGPIRTGMTAAIPDEHKTIFAKRRTALGRYGEPGGGGPHDPQPLPAGRLLHHRRHHPRRRRPDGEERVDKEALSSPCGGSPGEAGEGGRLGETVRAPPFPAFGRTPPRGGREPPLRVTGRRRRG